LVYDYYKRIPYNQKKKKLPDEKYWQVYWRIIPKEYGWLIIDCYEFKMNK